MKQQIIKYSAQYLNQHGDALYGRVSGTKQKEKAAGS